MSIQTFSSTQVINGFGVNTHCNWDTSAWSQGGAVVLACLKAIGAKVIRDGAPGWAAISTEYDQFFTGAGVKVLAVMTNGDGSGGDLSNAIAFNSSYPGHLFAIEGQNELDGAGIQPSTANSNQAKLYAAVKAAMPNMPVLNYSLTSTPDPMTYKGAKYDIGNMHPYSNSDPNYNGGNLGGVPEPNMLSGYTRYIAANPGATIAFTELGWTLGQDESWGLATDANRAIYTLRARFYALLLGVPLLCVYELMDNDSSGTGENSFGMFDSKGNPHAAGKAMSNIVPILADSGTVSSVTGTTATISGGVTYALAIQKSDGSQVIVLWNFNGSSNVSVSMPSSVSSMSVFDPIKNSTIGSVSNASSVSFTVPNYPLFVTISASAGSTSTTSTPPVVTAPTAPTSTASASANGTKVIDTTSSIVDASGRTWTLVSTPNNGYRIAVNGTTDTSTGFVTKLVYIGNNVFQVNKQNNGWVKIGGTGSWVAVSADVVTYCLSF